ncbi:MAG: quinol:electron acceptor oxidoreductase subunit ActD [Nitrospiria bacterium]
MMNDKKNTNQTTRDHGILGTFPSPAETRAALQALAASGHEDITLYSPMDPGELGLPVSQGNSPIGKFTLFGAIVGLTAGLLLSGGTAVLYPIQTGGMPILSLPAIGIISFEIMVLFSLLSTVLGFLYFALLSSDRKRFVPQRVSSDRFAIGVRGTSSELSSAATLLKRCGADRVEKQIARLWLGAAMLLLWPSLVLAWPWSQDMVDQTTRSPQEELVSLPPSIVPRQGKALEIRSKDEGPWIENPVPVSDDSLRIGKKLFQDFCVVCHGSSGKGDGIIAEKIGEFPDFTKEGFREQPGGCIFVAITNGANFASEIARPRPPLEEMSHEAHDDEATHDDDEREHQHDEEGADHEHEDALEDEHEADTHRHDETASTEGEHRNGHEDDHDHPHDESEPMETAEITHEHEDSHDHDEVASMDHAHENEEAHEHAHEDEHAHASEGPECYAEGHGHGEDGEDGHAHAHGSGKKHFMPPYRDALDATERWHIVNFVKHQLGRE